MNSLYEKDILCALADHLLQIYASGRRASSATVKRMQGCVNQIKAKIKRGGAYGVLGHILTRYQTPDDVLAGRVLGYPMPGSAQARKDNEQQQPTE